MIWLGNLLATSAFCFLGPLPVLEAVFGQSDCFTISSLVLQGVAVAAIYIACLCQMMKGIGEAGMASSEQAEIMVSSLYIVSDSVGSYLGGVIGAATHQG